MYKSLYLPNRKLRNQPSIFKQYSGGVTRIRMIDVHQKHIWPLGKKQTLEGRVLLRTAVKFAILLPQEVSSWDVLPGKISWKFRAPQRSPLRRAPPSSFQWEVPINVPLLEVLPLKNPPASFPVGISPYKNIPRSSVWEVFITVTPWEVLPVRNLCKSPCQRFFLGKHP